MILVEVKSIWLFTVLWQIQCGFGAGSKVGILGNFFDPAIIRLFDDVTTKLTRLSRDVTQASEYDQRSHCTVKDSQPPNRVDTKLRVESLREKMKENGFDAVIIPSSDEHQNEYVAPSDKRRGFITGFSGSAGTAVVTQKEQVLWTDTRYTLQGDQQMDCSWKLITTSSVTKSPAKWLADQLTNGSRVGADMKLFGASEWEKSQQQLNASDIALEDLNSLFDDVWESFGRPSSGNGSLFVHDLKFAGIRWEDKVSSIREDMKAQNADLLIVTALDEVAWILNLRGFDIPYNPVFRSYLILEANEEKPLHLFLRKHFTVPAEVADHLSLNRCSEEGICIELHEYSSIKEFIVYITKRDDIKKVFLSKSHPYSTGVSYYIYSAVPKEKRVLQESPIMLRKSRKEGPEGASMMEAQTKDSVALVEFFAWLQPQIANGATWDELSVQTPLRRFRGEQSHYRGESFETISAFGSNGAIVHYNPSNETKKIITRESLYLLDSGGQYLDGTTDVTRTLHFGTPTPFQREAYTRVLQGVIDLATLIFPLGTKDIFIDIIARRPIFDGGLNYGHGTGHGLGLYLSIHEGPTLLAMNDDRSSTIEVGQFFSDEPGYYKEGEFGIRLESIVRVVKHPTFKDLRGARMLQFEVTTLVPFEPKLIDASMLTAKQCTFLNDYNTRIRDVIGERLLKKGSREAYEWMIKKTMQLPCYGDTTDKTSNLTADQFNMLSLLVILLLVYT